VVTPIQMEKGIRLVSKNEGPCSSSIKLFRAVARGKIVFTSLISGDAAAYIVLLLPQHETGLSVVSELWCGCS